MADRGGVQWWFSPRDFARLRERVEVEHRRRVARVGLLRGGIGVGVRNVKSIGEMSNVPAAAAIANAVSHALGVQMDSLPLTPERVLEAIVQTRRDA